MPESFVQVTEGAGKKLHTNQRTIGANIVEDEVVVLGEPYLPTYVLHGALVGLPTADSHLLQIMAGSTLKVYITHIVVQQDSLAASSTQTRLILTRLTTAGTGGTASTPLAMDPSDAAAGATGMVLPTAKGTEGALILRGELGTTATAPIDTRNKWEWKASDHGGKPLIIPAGASNGLAVKNVSNITSATATISIYFREVNF